MKTDKFELFSLISCGYTGDKYDGLVLTDENTGKKYLIKHNVLDTYMIYEHTIEISGTDTIYKFK